MVERGSESVGIDLGTTYSSLAYVDRDGIPRMLCNAQGRSTIPSVIHFQEGGCVVGEPSHDASSVIAPDLARFIKSHMGSDWRRLYHGQMYTPESLSAIILRALVDGAEDQIGPVRQAVITVPAYFTEKRRRTTQHAGEIAGLNVIATLNEPMAATLAFCLNANPEEQTVLVYDLGGGTFDVTIVRITPAEVQELATNGILDVGGRDWDTALIDYAAEEILRQHEQDVRNDQEVMERLRQTCERVKRKLGRSVQTVISIEAFGHESAIPISKAEFEDRTASLLRSTQLTAELALEDAGIDWADLSRVILVGGASQMPAVRSMLEAATTAPIDSSVNPVTAVALGAAMYAHQLDAGRPIVTLTQSPPEEWSDDSVDARDAKDPSIQESEVSSEDPDFAPTVIRIHSAEDSSLHSDPFSLASEQPSVFTESPRQIRFVTAHGVGVKLKGAEGPRNSVLIPRNTPVPARASHIYLTGQPTSAETFVLVEITQGDTVDAGLAELLGVGRIQNFPAGMPAAQQIRVTMEFDEFGRLHVSAVHLATGKQMTLTLDIPGGLTQAEIRDQHERLHESPRLKVVHSPDDWFDGPDDDDDLSDLVEAFLD